MRAIYTHADVTTQVSMLSAIYGVETTVYRNGSYYRISVDGAQAEAKGAREALCVIDGIRLGAIATLAKLGKTTKDMHEESAPVLQASHAGISGYPDVVSELTDFSAYAIKYGPCARCDAPKDEVCRNTISGAQMSVVHTPRTSAWLAAREND